MQGVWLSFFCSLIIALLAIPTIIKVSYLKHLYDVPDDRKTHGRVIPTLGGLAIFAGFMISLCIFAPNHDVFITYKYLLAAVLIIFFIGLKDDILIISPIKKLAAQILAVSIIVLFGGVRLTSMYGLFGIEEISFEMGVMLTIFTMLVIMNGFNLIDGINLLSGGIGEVVVTTFGAWFYLNEFYALAIICSSLVGALIGFLWFNKTPAQIFMGDTGSLIVGLITSLICIKFIELNEFSTRLSVNSVPLIAFAVLIVPLFDTLRVFTWRILKGNSPLHPDRNHIHHRLLEIGFSHMKSSLLIMLANILIIIIAYTLQRLKVGSIPLLIILLTIAGTLSFIPSLIIRKRRNTIFSEGDKTQSL